MKDCKVDRACAHCGKKEASVLHYSSSLPSPQITSADNPKPEGAMVASTNQVLMQTATVTVQNTEDNFSIPVRLILDTDSQRSYITENLAKGLQLKLKQTKKLSVVTFGSNRPKNINCKRGCLNLLFKDGSTNCVPLNQREIEFLKGELVEGREIEFLKGELVEGKLADSLPCHAESIEMLIGNEYYFDLLEAKEDGFSWTIFISF